MSLSSSCLHFPAKIGHQICCCSFFRVLLQNAIDFLNSFFHCSTVKPFIKFCRRRNSLSSLPHYHLSWVSFHSSWKNGNRFNQSPSSHFQHKKSLKRQSVRQKENVTGRKVQSSDLKTHQCEKVNPDSRTKSFLRKRPQRQKALQLETHDTASLFSVEGERRAFCDIYCSCLFSIRQRKRK